MAGITTVPAYSAFEQQLRTLCLREFPCGAGTWMESKPKNRQLPQPNNNVDSQFSVTLKDYGANHEKTETLEEYVGSKFSPWHLDYSWSAEAKKLRELAVKSPWLIDDNFVLNFFKTLRICDKNVTEVDENLLKFKQLEELTLSANHLVSVNSRNLPSSLKVLELCANQISDISALCVRPPPLIHLGLGNNRISFMGDYLTGDYWPYLLSLDLSHNNLSDLLDVIRKLGSLPKLRNLILQGNPLSLIAGYRGYTIDSLRKLSILDDIMISADERHHYKGLARRREYILDEAKVFLEVTYIKGVPMPEELKNPEEQPEFPKVERKYFVQFMFPHDTSQKAEVFQISHEDFPGMSPLPTNRSQYTPHQTSPIPEGEGLEERSPSQQSQNTEAVKNVNFTTQPEVVSARQPTAEDEHPPDEIPLSATPKQSESQNGNEPEDTKVDMQLEGIKSEGGTWMEEIELNWTQEIVRDDLLTLRDFFKQGMNFSVVEEVVLCYEKEDSSEPGTPTARSKGKEGKDKKSDKKDDKAKAVKEEKKDDKKDDKKGGKKKKEPEVELKRMPPTYTTLATWHIPLEDFLEGDYEFRSVFTQGGVEVASTVKSFDIKKDKDKKKPGSSKPKKDEKGGKGTPDGRRMSASGTKNAKDDKKVDKGKAGKAPAAPVAEEEEEQPPPPPLEVQMAVRLHHWRTAMDSLKEEEEKNKAMAEEQQQV